MWPFKKYHALGNDFIIVDDPNIIQAYPPQDLCHRHFGIGADQLLMVRPIQNKALTWDYLIYNQDGSPASHCGNGARCLMHYLATYQQAPKNALLTLQTSTTTITGQYHPLSPTVQWSLAQHRVHPMKNGTFVDIGNPHLIVTPKAWIPEHFETQSAELSAQYPEGINVTFIRPLKPSTYQAIVFERGVGRTWACGSAAVAIALSLGQWDQPIEIQMPGGQLIVETIQATYTVQLTGNIKFAFEGHLI